MGVLLLVPRDSLTETLEVHLHVFRELAHGLSLSLLVEVIVRNHVLSLYG
jgi:hypothetical protein